MPRKRLRTTEKCKWSLELLDRAVKRVVDDGISLHKAAKEFDIPYSTLQKRYRRSEQLNPRLGRKPTFSTEQEEILAGHLIRMSNLFYGLDSMKFRRIAYECAEKLGITHNFNKESKCAGPDWLEGFLNRNRNISIRKPEATSINRIEGFNREEVDLFYKNLEELMVKNRYETLQIFNMDETGVTTVQDPGKILAKTGQKRVGSATSWERGKTVTAVCAMSAAGAYVPPMFIFPRQRHSVLLEKDGPPGAIYNCSKNGWTNESLFLEWLQHFKKFTKSSEDNKILLILDNHTSHATLEAYQFCKNNYITMLSIPPHSSHRLQPLDVTFFGPLKRAYNNECDLYLKSKQMTKITPYDIAGLFQKAYSRVASIDKAISGFRATGISPINTNLFSSDDFYVVNTATSNVENSSIDDSNLLSLPNQSTDMRDLVQETSAEDAHVTEDPVIKNSAAIDQNLVSGNQLNTDESIRNVLSSSSELNSILALVSPEPSTSREIRKRTHKQHSQIITATPNKTILEEKKKKRLMKENKAPKGKGKQCKERKKKNVKKTIKGKKFLFKDKSSSSEESDNDGIICDDNSSDYVDEDSNMCMICCESGKRIVVQMQGVW